MAVCSHFIWHSLCFLAPSVVVSITSFPSVSATLHLHVVAYRTIMVQSILGSATTAVSLLGLLAAKAALADDYLVSERHGLYKRQNSQSKNITFLHINDVHAHLDEYRSSGRHSITFSVQVAWPQSPNQKLTFMPCVTIIQRHRLSSKYDGK